MIPVRLEGKPEGRRPLSRAIRHAWLVALVVPLLASSWPEQARAEERAGVVPSRMPVDFRVALARPRFLEYAPREHGSPAVDADRGWVFVGDRFGVFRAFDTSGRPRWEVDLGGGVQAGAVVSDGRVYAVTLRGRVVCLDARSGDELWSYRGGAELATTPTLVDETLLVPSLTDTVLALDASSGDFVWLHRRPRQEGLAIRGAAPVISDGQRVFTGFSDGAVVALDLADGSVSWQARVGTGENRDVNASPVLLDGRLYVVSYGGTLHALEATTGREEWMVPVSNGATRMTVANDRLIIVSPGSVSAHRVADGTLSWRTKVEDGSPSELSVIRDRLAFGTENGPLVVLSTNNGRPLHAFDVGTGVSAGPAVDMRGLWVVSNGGWLYRLSWPAP